MLCTGTGDEDEVGVVLSKRTRKTEWMEMREEKEEKERSRKKEEKTERRRRGEEEGERRQTRNGTNIHLDRSSKTSSNPASFIQVSMIGTVLWFAVVVAAVVTPGSSGTFRLLS